MTYLEKIDPKNKCYCGWFMKGECPHCPENLSCQDKLDMACPGCHNAPWPETLSKPIIHVKGCKFEEIK